MEGMSALKGNILMQQFVDLDMTTNESHQELSLRIDAKRLEFISSQARRAFMVEIVILHGCITIMNSEK
jgi:hypothetical protein